MSAATGRGGFCPSPSAGLIARRRTQFFLGEFELIVASTSVCGVNTIGWDVKGPECVWGTALVVLEVMKRDKERRETDNSYRSEVYIAVTSVL